MTQQARSIRVIAIPPGEAPLWVREKWVGLELPLADGENAAQQAAYTSGVLSGPSNRFLAIIWGLMGRLKVQSGYPVYVKEALAILEQTAPDAAMWWRENVPRLQGPKRNFLFANSVCRVIDTKSMTSSPVPHISTPS